MRRLEFCKIVPNKSVIKLPSIYVYTKSYFEKNSFRSPNGHFRSILWSGISSSAGQETIATFRPKSEHFLIAFQQRSRATVCGECTHSMHYLPLRNIQGLYYFLMMKVLQKKGKCLVQVCSLAAQ